jgi:hypothetical protein
MINLLNITTDKPPNRALAFGLIITILVVIAASTPAFAHGGFDHFTGTVVKFANNALTVKTARGNVDVKMDNQTYLTRNDQKAQLSDLKVGARVVVDVPKGSEDKLAHSVKIGGVTKPVDQQAHGSRR